MLKKFHNESDLKNFEKETITIKKVLSKVFGKQLGQKELISLIFISLHEEMFWIKSNWTA